MTSTFDRRKTVSTHHELWIELGRIELAIERSQQNDVATGNAVQSRLKQRQVQLREALASLDS